VKHPPDCNSISGIASYGGVVCLNAGPKWSRSPPPAGGTNVDTCDPVGSIGRQRIAVRSIETVATRSRVLHHNVL